MGRRPCASAFFVTKLVCGMGPSTASTKSTTESTIESTRSTSPPKSAWPGVSTILMRQSCPSGALQPMAVFLARIVMPRSFSISPLSMTRSSRSPRSSSVPDWRRSLSTRVVLPWSTWATMATLRRNSTELDMAAFHNNLAFARDLAEWGWMSSVHGIFGAQGHFERSGHFQRRS